METSIKFAAKAAYIGGILMKKYTVFGICCLTAVFLAIIGCDHDGERGSSDQGSIGLGITRSQLAENPVRLAGAQITFEQAVQIAFEHSGSGTVKEIELERKKSGLLVYEVEIIGNQRKYEVQVDAITGTVIRAYEKRSSSSYMNNDSFISQITSANAAIFSETGLEQVGSGTVEEMGWELTKNGQYIFEIEIRDASGRKHEVKIDPATGEIISSKSKK